MLIEGTKQEIEELKSKSNYDFDSVDIRVVEMGSITDEELDIYHITNEQERDHCRKEYASHKKGFFPNPYCALH